VIFVFVANHTMQGGHVFRLVTHNVNGDPKHISAAKQGSAFAINPQLVATISVFQEVGADEGAVKTAMAAMEKNSEE
jgi:hypothetical protein